MAMSYFKEFERETFFLLEKATLKEIEIARRCATAATGKNEGWTVSVGAVLPSHPTESPEDVAVRVAEKLLERRNRLPSLAEKQTEVARVASEAAAALAREKQQHTLMSLGASLAAPNRRRRPPKVVGAPSTTAAVYSQDQDLVRKRRPKPAWLEPKELEAEWMRSRYRDEGHRERKWREYAAEYIAVESRGSGFSSDDAKRRDAVQRHPIHRLVADVSYDEFAKLLDQLHATAGKEVMEAVNKAWTETCEDLRLSPNMDSFLCDQTVPKGDHASPQDEMGSVNGRFETKAAGPLITPPAPQPTLPPPLADWDCLVAGVSHRLESTMDDVKVWVHRRREKADDGEWRSWQWRISVYHLATGTTYHVKLNQDAAMGVIDETSTPQAKELAATRAVEGSEAAAAAETAIEAAYYECESTHEAFETENAPRFAKRAAGARLRDRAALVEGLIARGSLSRAAKLTPTALLLLPLLRLEHDKNRQISAQADRADGAQSFIADGTGRIDDAHRQKARNEQLEHEPCRRLVLGTGTYPLSEGAFENVVDKTDDGTAILRHGDAKTQRIQQIDRGLCSNDEGATWEDQADPIDLAPLALRVCELAGEIYDGKVPGAVAVGAPLLTTSRVVGMFERNEACSSSNSINVTVVAAFEDSIRAKSQLVLADLCSVSPESSTATTTTALDNFLLEAPLLPRVDVSSCMARAASPSLLPSPTVTTALVLPDEPRQNVREQSGRGPFRSACSFTGLPVWRCLQSSAEMHCHIFGIRESAFRQERCCGPNKPSLSNRFVWSSVQCCFEQLCRRRDEMDFVSTIQKPPSCESSRPLIFRSKQSALDEATYTQVDLLRSTDTACLEKLRAIGECRKRAEQRRLVSIQLANIQDNDTAHAELATMETRKRLAEKARRLLERSAPHSLGDSVERWMNRLEGSTLIETRGTWERRRGKSSIFFHNLDDLADPPRFTWDTPACWKELRPREAPSVVKRQLDDEMSNDAALDVRDGRSAVTEISKQDIKTPESSTTLITERTEDYWSDYDGEIGDVSDWRDILESAPLPQDHGDRRILRGSKDKHREADRHKPSARVPPLIFPREESSPPAFETPTWQRLDWRRKGRYWRELPRAQLTARFVSYLTEPVVGAATTLSSAPSCKIVGVVRNTSDSKTWGGAKHAPYLPSKLVTTIFVNDPVDDVGRILGAADRRAKREAAVATPLSLDQLIERGSGHEKTSAEEQIERNEFETAIIEGRAKEDRNQLRQRALFAARSSNISDLEACIDTFQVDTNTKDDNGNTLLILAAQQNDIRLVKYLLRRGADINRQNYAGNSALHFCFGYSYDELGDWLISKGANPGFINQDGLTCYEFNKIEHV